MLQVLPMVVTFIIHAYGKAWAVNISMGHVKEKQVRITIGKCKTFIELSSNKV